MPVDDLKNLVNLLLQRETGSEELDELSAKGGIDWLIKGLGTDPKAGIDAVSIADREAHFGFNRRHPPHPRTLWDYCKEALEDFILRVLIVAGIASIIINEIMEPENRNIAWIEGFAILFAVFVIVMVTASNNLKKEREFIKLNTEAEAGKKVSVIRNGKSIDDLDGGDIQVGDLMAVKSGMEIPADGCIIGGSSLQMDESSMTGETKPMNKDTLDNCLKKKENLQKSKGIDKLGHNDIPSPIILAGTKVLTGNGSMVVINVGKNSAIGKIKEILESGENELTPLQRKLEKIARDVGFFGLISAIAIFSILVIRFIIQNSHNKDGGWGSRPTIEYVNDVLHYFLIAIAILVVAIPEGLPLAVTLSMAYSVNQMMKDNNLVRKLQACETMGGANIICSDKTGTLTRNEMYLTHFWNGREIVVYDSEKDQPIDYKEFVEPGSIDLFLDTIVCNSLEDPKKKGGNPTEVAILRYLDKCDINVVERREKAEHLFQATFSSDRKRMSTIVKTLNGKQYAFIKGASEYIIQISNKFHDLESGKISDMSKLLIEQLDESIENMAKKALRTIGLAYKEVNIDQIDKEKKDDHGIYDYELSDFTIIGICGIKDIIRAEVPESVRKCHHAGIDVKMVTGDNKITARAIAEEVNIINDDNERTAIVMEGPEFLRKIGGVICANCRDLEKCECVSNEQELSKPENKGKMVRKDTIKNPQEFDKIWKDLRVLARSRPEDKYALVIGLKERGNIVAVTGDGTNDAPALSRANVGFAMGIAGTEVAKQAASIMIMDDNFASIVLAVKWGRNIYDAIRKFLVFQLTVNLVAVITTFICALTLEQSILSTVQMLWINLIMDTLAALALATEPPTEELLDRKPYGKDEYIISPIMMKHIIGQAIFQIVVLMMLVFYGERFLFDIMQKRQLQPGTNHIVSGRLEDGYNRKDHDGQDSIHFTYIFNIFVMLQFFNFFNARILDDRLNIFSNITRSRLLIIILVVIFVMQAVFLTFCGRAMQVVFWGLDPISWLFCIGVGMLGWVVSFMLKFIPLEHYLPGGGEKEITREEMNRLNSISVRRSHTSNFYRKQSVIERKTSIISGHTFLT